MIRETPFKAGNGYVALFLLLALFPATGYLLVQVIGGGSPSPALVIALVLLLLALLVALGGLFVVNPGEARVLTLFGDYKGTVKGAGFWFANPFMSKQKVSLRVRNFETSKLKVNDSDSNPIEIGAIVVWRVVDTAEALFEVDNYEEFVKVQSESALRTLATAYPYDSHGTGAQSLSTHIEEVSQALKEALHARLAKAGVDVTEARISHLAYSPEIAGAMLQRQQAGAIIAARQKIVEGAVGMVQQALEKLKEQDVVQLDEERKAAMVSNLLVVLCSDRAAHPVVNAGSLY